MADLAKVHAADLGFDSSGNFTTSAFDTTGDTWLIFQVSVWSAVLTNITALTYNGVSLLSQVHKNGATAHFAANVEATYYLALGANAGNHTFNIQWTGGGEFEFIALSGNGGLDAAVIDASGFVDVEVDSGGGTVTPTAYTPTTDKALPIFVVSPFNDTPTTANANCTKDATNTRTITTLYHGPLSTPAGTATNAVMNDASVEHVLITSFALKPSAAAGGFFGSPLAAIRAGHQGYL